MLNYLNYNFMLTLEILVLVVCVVVACWAIRKIVMATINLLSLLFDDEYHLHVEKGGMVFNKNTRKLEADNSQSVPFE